MLFMSFNSLEFTSYRLFGSLMSLCAYVNNSTVPVIAICGPTGTGKSKLAIDLASIFHGEVINADAVQLYKGLAIATNKVSPAEASGVPHHLIGCFPPTFAYCADVHKYKAVCLPTIDEIRLQRKRIPFLVGGTHYYQEAILWSDFLTQPATLDSNAWASVELPTDLPECYAQLQTLNPQIASNLHPNDGRKVRKALREALQHQFDHSHNRPAENKPSDLPPNRSYQPRYPGQSLLIWLDCDPLVLNGRLDDRVDQMIRNGLVAELDKFVTDYFQESERFDDKEAQASPDRVHQIHRLFNETHSSTQACFTRRGILQSIGFKEFADYLSLPPGPGERDTPRGQQLLAEAINQVKLATRQYARRQVKWIVNRFLRRPQLGSLPVYRLDVTQILTSTNPDAWDRYILAPACRILHEHMAKAGTWSDSVVLDSERLRSLFDLCPEADCPDPCELQPVLKEEPLDAPLVCTACGDKMFVRLSDFEAHSRSRSHQKRVSKLRRRARIKAIES